MGRWAGRTTKRIVRSNLHGEATGWDVGYGWQFRVAMALVLACPAALHAQLLEAGSPAEGAWFDPATPGQGLLLDALPASDAVFAAWFTWEQEAEDSRQRWLTGLLRVNGPVASGPILLASGGRFATPPGSELQQEPVGTLTLDFLDCATARVSYSVVLPDHSESGSFVARSGASLTGEPACTTGSKLRWPHADPALGPAEYQALADAVFIPNNYAVHQGGVAERPGDLYLHSGIDIVTENGDPIFALQDGVVRSISPAGSGNFTVTVETTAEPGRGWSYVHIVPEVAVGDAITSGQRLGTVNFGGLPHLHLSRIRQPAGATDWSHASLLNEDPTAFFDIPDEEPPLFRPQLLFFPDGSDAAFPQGTPTQVSGAVDIVAGIRDPGPHSRFDFNGTVLGDRHNVAWIEYEIRGAGVFLHRRSFDFHNLVLAPPPGDIWSMGPLARVIVMPTLTVPVAEPDRLFNYYRITHGSDAEQVSLADAERAWDTAALDQDGSALFPDGEYTVTVRAADWAGNIAEVQDAVEVRND